MPVYLPLPALQALDEVLEEAEALGEPAPAQLLLGLLRRDALVIGACPGADFRTDESIANSGGPSQAPAVPPAKRHMVAPAVAQAVRGELWEALEGPLAGKDRGELGARAAAYARLLEKLRPDVGTGVEECARQSERLSCVYRSALQEILGPRDATEWVRSRGSRAQGARQRGTGPVNTGRALPAAIAVQLDPEDLALVEAVPPKHRPKVRRVLEITKRRRLTEDTQGAVGPSTQVPRDADSAAARSLVLRRQAGAPEDPSKSEEESGEEEEDYDAEDLEQQVEKALLEEYDGR